MAPRGEKRQATRERVLAAARDLFDEVGYEAATIREVAGRAGVSVGSVFTGFAGKAELLSQVMADRVEALQAELEHVSPHLRGPTADRLRSIMAVHYGFEARRLKLFVAYVACSFTWPADGAVSPIGRNHRFRGLLVDVLKGGVERGDVRADVDIDLFIDTLLAAYVWNYRRASQDGADAQTLIANMDRQIGLLFDGVAPRR
ncbi:MAG TPA: TetR/AcrR family transcriptional regulator [Caulobacteraceae bacterium]|nr:TetR/AcrR family transcriptional regulator [Caulobacteraceae bacterium]